MNCNEFNWHTILQRESTVEMKALKTMTGIVWQQETRDASGVSQSSLRADWWWADLGQAMTWTRAAVWASATISGPVICGGVRSPTIFEEGVASYWQQHWLGVVAVAGDGRRRRGTVWQAPRAELPPLASTRAALSTASCTTSPKKLPTSSTIFEATNFLAFNCLRCLRIVVVWTYTPCCGRWTSCACRDASR